MQIALTQASAYIKGHELRVSTEPIYNCVYAQPAGRLKKDGIQALRHGRNHKQRARYAWADSRHAQHSPRLTTHSIEDRLLPVHLESDLIKNEDNANVLGTLVERTYRLVIHNMGSAVNYCDPHRP